MRETETDQVEQRKLKIRELREIGYDPFSNKFKPDAEAKPLYEKYDSMTKDELQGIDQVFKLSGRVVAKRDFGKSLFFHITDSTGKIQGYIQSNRIGKDKTRFFQKYVDIGDFIGVSGGLFKTKTGELTVSIDEFDLLTKSLRPLPEKWHGLQDTETRYRQRYLDLIANPEVKSKFKKRTEIIRSIRRFLDDRDYTEVETPILHSIAGGAAAKPFVTYHNALDRNLFLRIAPELYLKRLVIGGLERIYEIGRTFRNEGVSTKHNPEFTMIELYQAYSDFRDLMELIEEMISSVAKQVNGDLITQFGEKTIDFSTPWKRVNIIESLTDEFGNAITEDENLLFQTADKYGVDHFNIKGKAITELFEATIGESLTDPAFVYGFPLDVSPLARRNNENPEITDRFELFINGWEIANAFSELNDPVDQKNRFLEQMKQKEKGEEEYHHMDEDFIRALEYGMPPTAGAGIGIDRLVMLLTNSQSIREVIFFPHLRS